MICFKAIGNVLVISGDVSAVGESTEVAKMMAETTFQDGLTDGNVVWRFLHHYVFNGDELYSANQPGWFAWKPTPSYNAGVATSLSLHAIIPASVVKGKKWIYNRFANSNESD